MRESHAERDGTRMLRQEGIDSVKLGKEGWPDRLYFLDGDRVGQHFFVEWKKEKNSELTPAQRRRIAKLRARGEAVAVCVSPVDALDAARSFWHMEWKSARWFNTEV